MFQISFLMFVGSIVSVLLGALIRGLFVKKQVAFEKLPDGVPLGARQRSLAELIAKVMDAHEIETVSTDSSAQMQLDWNRTLQLAGFALLHEESNSLNFSVNTDFENRVVDLSFGMPAGRSSASSESKEDSIFDAETNIELFDDGVEEDLRPQVAFRAEDISLSSED